MVHSIIEISDREYQALSKLLTGRYGIKLPDQKRVMFQSRLQSRLRELQIDSFKTYCDYILEPENTEPELEKMISFVSTNKTEFFREDQHFKFLEEVVLPAIAKQMKPYEEQVLNCWSAGCSRGQEAFSMAMIIDFFCQQYAPNLDYFIHGTDVSEKVLNIAQRGVYPFLESERIPQHFLKEYILKSKDHSNPRIKINKALRSKIQFQYGNLMDEDYAFKTEFQIIFIRNTLIYFDTETQTAILKKILSYLVLGGYLFIGHSESLINRDLPIQIIAPSIYQKIES